MTAGVVGDLVRGGGVELLTYVADRCLDTAVKQADAVAEVVVRGGGAEEVELDDAALRRRRSRGREAAVVDADVADPRLAVGRRILRGWLRGIRVGNRIRRVRVRAWFDRGNGHDHAGRAVACQVAERAADREGGRTAALAGCGGAKDRVWWRRVSQHHVGLGVGAVVDDGDRV